MAVFQYQCHDHCVPVSVVVYLSVPVTVLL
uniref:Uncharacterized protein n=1 Tax=Anguilla anguilla TaxID=7936 RepID=A0A0E9RF87_ANGAN